MTHRRADAITPTTAKRAIQGPIVVDKSPNGILYYVGNNTKLCSVNGWVNADNDRGCPWPGNPYDTTNKGYAYQSVYKTDSTENANILKPDTVKQKNIEREEMSVQVFPNPSKNTFTFTVENIESISEVEVRVQDINGRIVYENRKKTASESEQYQLIWDAINVNAGIFIYSVRVNNMKVAGGKLIKL